MGRFVSVCDGFDVAESDIYSAECSKLDGATVALKVHAGVLPLPGRISS